MGLTVNGNGAIMSRKDKIVKYIAEHDDCLIMYNDETVLDINEDDQFLVTVKGEEHLGEYEFEQVDWDQVKVYAPVL